MVRTEIKPVIGRILGDQVELLNPLRYQVFALLNNVGLRAASMCSAHPGDDAETARMVAAFRNFNVGKMFRSQSKPRRRKIRYVLRPDSDIKKWSRVSRERAGRGEFCANVAIVFG